MSQPARGSRAVFVGNIPFEYTEEQLINVFKEVGPVANSGRPKGYGFCEYYDAETAASAVRNLNDYEIGGRQLRVDYASMDDNHNRAASQQAPPVNQYPQQQQQQQQPPIQQHAPVNHPPPIQRPSPPTTSHDDINKVLSTMSPQDLLTLMRQMKQLSIERPEYAREFLSSNPQVAYALFQAMVIMNLVDPNLISRLMSSLPQQQQKQQPPPQQQQQPPPMMQQQPPPMMQQQPPPMMQQQPPPMMQQQPPSMMQQQMVPPPMGQPMNQPMSQPPMQGNAPDPAAEQQKALLMQVLQLTEDQINNLPPEHREQVRQLKAQLTMQQS
ncbi:unnamed protein product [Cunninghamella blakesleeana]